MKEAVIYMEAARQNGMPCVVSWFLIVQALHPETPLSRDYIEAYWDSGGGSLAEASKKVLADWVFTDKAFAVAVMLTQLSG